MEMLFPKWFYQHMQMTYSNGFYKGQEDVSVLTQTIGLYEKASSARVNRTKSEGFIIGNWEHTATPDLPGGLRWKKMGIINIYHSQNILFIKVIYSRSWLEHFLPCCP